MKENKIKILPLIVSIAIPLALGQITNLLIPNIKMTYESLDKPNFAPPGIIFPIVWTILFILMGIASYQIYMLKYENIDASSALFVYSIQLLLNFLWSFIFFGFRLYGLAFIELIILMFFVILTIKRFYDKGGKVPALLLIPYFLWLIYAGLINYFVWMLNEM